MSAINAVRQTSASSVQNPSHSLVEKQGGSNGVKDAENTVYGGYLSSYGNKAELPLDIQDYLLKMKSQSDILSNVVSLLMLEKANEGYERIKAKSSNEDELTVKTKRENTIEPVEPVSIAIERLASSQMNESKSLPSFNHDLEAKKSYDFNIEKAGKTVSFSIEAKPSDYNKRVLQRLADRVNESSAGVRAEVQSTGSHSRLALESDKTGADQAFEISGSLAEALEMKVSREAGDAVYSVNNGERRSSNSNRLEVSEELTVYLKKAETTPVTIRFDKDTGEAKDSLRKLVNSYNSLLADSGNNSGFEKLYSQMTTLTAAHEAPLAEAGIYVQKDGNLSLDDTRIDKAIENGSLAKLFTGNEDAPSFGQKLGAIAEKVDSNPGAYINNERPGRAKDRTVNMDYVNALDKYGAQGMLFSDMF